MPVLLSCQGLSKSYGQRPLFQNISLGVNDRERMGMIGPNGAGKSTLLKLFAAQEKPDSGTISMQRGLPLSYVPQEEAFAEGATVESVLTDALAGSHLTEAEQSVRLAIVLAQFGFDDPAKLASELSGGWRKRLAIARGVIREPELLLIDEPTNHLDLEGVLWLETFLRDAPFAILMVSHDRQFLENVCNRILELNPIYAEGFLSVSGNYSEFLVKREEYRAAQAHQEVTLQTQAKREIEWLQRGAQARSTKAQARIDSAGRLLDELSEVKYRNAQGKTAGIDFVASGRQTRDLVVAKGISKSLGGRTLFANLDLTLAPRRRLGLLGANGSGKTTLLRLLTGEREPDSGTIKRADGLRIVYFDQSRAHLDTSLSLRDALSPNSDTVIYQGNPMHVSGWAKRFLFRSEQLNVPLSVLSGGEQARVLIAQLMLKPADLLIMDEPTNDLDIPTLEALEESLTDFPGSLVLVTHDRYLLDRVSTEILALDGRGGVGFFASYAQWEAVRNPAPEPSVKASAKAAAPPAASTSGLTAAERREFKGMEEKIEAAEAQVQQIKRDMEDPKVATDAARLHDLWNSLPQAEEAVSLLYARWEELETRIR